MIRCIEVSKNGPIRQGEPEELLVHITTGSKLIAVKRNLRMEKGTDQ